MWSTILTYKNKKDFWDKVRESAKMIQAGPDWMKAGITLNPEHFETYPPERE